MALIKGPETLAPPTVDTNLGEDIKNQNEERQNTKEANEALGAAGIKVDPTTQTVDTAGLAQASRDWKDYMQNFLENNTQRILDNTVPEFAIVGNKVRVTGTEAALNSPLTKDAEKALSSLAGADVASEDFAVAVAELNAALKDNVKNYIITESYGFKDADDYNNYLLAVQEAKKPNPRKSTFKITAKKKDGTYDTMSIEDWLKYWKTEYTTDERVDLFLQSAEAGYGYDRIPYVIMSGGGMASNAKYGFDNAEYLSLGVYNFGKEVSKLPHGLTQNTTGAISGFLGSVDTLKRLANDDGMTDDKAKTLILKASETPVTKEMFDRIKAKVTGTGPIKGDVNSLTDNEKAILAMGIYDTASLDEARKILGNNASPLTEADYEVYRKRANDIKNSGYLERDEKMSAVNERIAKNMMVYGGQTLNFASTMMGLMTRQFIEAYAIKALTGGAVDMNAIGENLGDAVINAFGGIKNGSIAGSAAARTVARFVGGIPEDMLQDFVDAKLTGDNSLADDILTGENVVSNIVYRLTFNAIAKGTKNFIGEARKLSAMAKAAKAAGVNIDADDVKRGVSEAVDALEKGRELVYGEDGSVSYYDDEGNLKRLDGVNVWNMQPLAEDAPENVLSDNVKNNLNELTEKWKKDRALRASEVQDIKNYFETGEWNYTVDKIPGNEPHIEIPKKLRDTIIDFTINKGRDLGDEFDALRKKLPEWGLDDKTIQKAAANDIDLKANLALFNDIFGTKISAEGKTLDSVLTSMVKTLLKKSGKDSSAESVNKIVNELMSPDRFGRLAKRRATGEDANPKANIFGLTAVKDFSSALNDLNPYKLNSSGKIHPYIENSLFDSSFPAMAVRDAVEELMANIMDSYAKTYDAAIKNVPVENVVEFASMGVDALTNAIEKSPDVYLSGRIKSDLDDLVASLDAIEYQRSYNRNFTELPDYVTRDIHSSNELGVKMNADKEALMQEALTQTPGDFVFGKLSTYRGIHAGNWRKFLRDLDEGNDTSYSGVDPLEVDVFHSELISLRNAAEASVNPQNRTLLELRAEDVRNKWYEAHKSEPVSKEGFTQNELLEIWTETQYRAMTVDRMMEIMTENFGDEGLLGENMSHYNPAVKKAQEYIGSPSKNVWGEGEVDRRFLDYWFSVTARGKNADYDVWLDELEKSGNPAFYKDSSNPGAPSKESGRSILELYVLQNPKLWAASLIQLKDSLSSYAETEAFNVAGDIVRGAGLSNSDAGSLQKALMKVYTSRANGTPGAEAMIGNALDLYENGVSPEMVDLFETYRKETGASVIDSPTNFVQWAAEKYAMGRNLYLLKEHTYLTSLPMRMFLTEPLTVGRVEKVWGPGRMVDNGNGPEAPSMRLENETTLGFSVDLTGSGYGTTDPGSITMKVRPIDIIGDLNSAYAGEREVFVRKSLAYPAGNKMHSIFFDGTITTDAYKIVGDKNARMFQVDESLVVNNYDYRKIKEAFAKNTDILAVLARNRDGAVTVREYLNKYANGESTDGAPDEVAKFISYLKGSVYGKEIATALGSDNPFMKTFAAQVYSKLGSKPLSSNISNELAVLLNKPFVVQEAYEGKVYYQKGISPELDSEIATNGGVHLNDTQAKRTADADKVLRDWRDAANKLSEADKYRFFADNAGIDVDGNTVSFSNLLDNMETTARLRNAQSTANMASDRITMGSRLESQPSQAPDPVDWANDKTFKFKSYADALANRPSYKDAQYFDKWLPAAVDAGMKEFTDWRDGIFLKNHPDIDMPRTVESWDFINYLVHRGDDTTNPNMDEIIGKTFIDSSGTEVTITQDVVDLYGEYDAFIRAQGARIAALRAQGFMGDYNQLGYLPHTDYNPLEQSAEEMLQGVLWKKNELKNSSSEDGTFTTEKLNNDFESRYRIWISNMAFDSLGDVAIFGEKMKELIADGVITVNKRGAKLNGKKPQEAVAKAISGDKDLNKQAAKTKSSKDFKKAQTDINNKTDFKAMEKQIASDMKKMGMSKATHETYSPIHGGQSKVVTQKNVFVSKITSLYDFMKNTSTTDGSLLNNGGEMLLNPAGMANNIVRQYAQGGVKLKDLVVNLLMEKSGRSRKGAEYIYNRWLPDIAKHVREDGTINSTELAALLTKHLRFEAWSGIKKWLGRADYSGFNTNTRKTMDNLLYRHNMIQQISQTPSVMKTLNKALDAVVGIRHRALFWLNPKNAILQLSECIRLFSNFQLGDARKALTRLVNDEDWRNYVADWKDIVMPDGSRLENVQPMADAWNKTASSAKLGEDGTLNIKNTIKGGIQESDAVMMAPINAAESMKNTVLLSGILQEMETKKKNGTLKEPEYDYVMRRFQRIALANDEFGRLGYSDSAFARAVLYLQNFSIRQLKMFGDNVVDTWGNDGAGKAFAYIAKTIGFRLALFLVLSKLGYSAGQVLGYDPFGMLGNDYTGLDEDDETELDRQIKSGVLSPLFVGGLTSMIQDYYFAGRQAYERTNTATPADEAESITENTEDFGWKMPDVDWFELLYSWAPGGQAAKRNIQMAELLDKGTAISSTGTKMYEAPSDLGNALVGFTFGRSNTANARDYYQTPDPLQGLIDNGLGGFAQQFGRAFSSGFRNFDPIDSTDYSDWFDGSAADEQQWQSGYYYFRREAKRIYDNYSGKDSSFNTDTDTGELKSSYENEMNELGEKLKRFTDAYIKKHGSLDGTKMQQLVNILNDAQINLLMNSDTREAESLAGLNRAQERYTNADLPRGMRQTGPSERYPDTELGTRFSPQFYSAIQGYYGAGSEAYDIVNKLYNDKWKALRKEYSNRAYADGVSFKDREKIQNEYINAVRQDLDGVIALYGKNILTNDGVDNVMNNVFAGMVPYSEYNINKYGKRVSLPSNTEVDISDWLLEKYSKASSTPTVGRSAKMDSLIDKMNSYLNNGNKSMAKATARLILERVDANRASLTRDQIEEVQRVLND